MAAGFSMLQQMPNNIPKNQQYDDQWSIGGKRGDGDADYAISKLLQHVDNAGDQGGG